MSKHTPGPWRWEVNEKHKTMQLVGGKPTYDLTVMDFERWGMYGAVARMRDTAEDGMNILYRCLDWAIPAKGREHHASWFKVIDHPDANLIAAAPDLLEALIEERRIRLLGQQPDVHWESLRDARRDCYAKTDAAIAKAKGETA